jgi:hypothetical protein
LYHSINTARSADKIKLAVLEKKNSALCAEKAVLMEEAGQLKYNLEMLKKMWINWRKKEVAAGANARTRCCTDVE